MRVLLANFRHLYQRRGLWIVYAGLGLAVLLFVVEGGFSASKGGGLVGALLVCAFLWGLLLATLQMETASRPLSFCLPGHRDAVRRLLFLVGLIVSLAFLLICVMLLASGSFTGLFERSIMPPRLLVVVLGAYFCANMAAYLLGAGTAFRLIHSASTLSVMVSVVVVCMMFDLFLTIEYPILHWPVGVIVLALIVGVASWWWLGRRAWLRRSCSRPWMGFFDPWDRKQVQRYRELYATRFTKTTPRLDRLFQRIMGHRSLSDLGTYAWGALYTTGVLVAPQWRGVLTVALVGVALAGYFPPLAPMFMSFLPLMTAGFLQSPLGTALLVAGGRKERFFATAALILGLSILWVLLFGLLVGLTHLLAPLVPAVTVRGVTLSLHAISFQVLGIPLVLVPLVGLVQTLFCRKPAWLMLSITLVTTLIIISSTPLGLYCAITPALAIAGTVLSWGICLSLLYRIAMHRDLVRQ